MAGRGIGILESPGRGMPVARTGLLIVMVELRASGGRTDGAASRLGAGKLALGAANWGGFSLDAPGTRLLRVPLDKGLVCFRQ